MNIGNWIKRAGQKWHLVESVVADRAVVRCGKEMHRVTASGGELEVSPVMPLTRMIGQPQLCKGGCDREDATVADVVAAFPPGEVVVVDDDGSTHDELVP